MGLDPIPCTCSRRKVPVSSDYNTGESEQQSYQEQEGIEPSTATDTAKEEADIEEERRTRRKLEAAEFDPNAPLRRAEEAMARRLQVCRALGNIVRLMLMRPIDQNARRHAQDASSTLARLYRERTGASVDSVDRSPSS